MRAVKEVLASLAALLWRIPLAIISVILGFFALLLAGVGVLVLRRSLKKAMEEARETELAEQVTIIDPVAIDAAEDMEPCQICGAYVSTKHPSPCDLSDCPYGRK
jgi:hypothetical protein